jgi:hypothetical protein
VCGGEERETHGLADGGHLRRVGALAQNQAVGLQERDEFGHDFRSGLWLFGERNALSGPQR